MEIERKKLYRMIQEGESYYDAIVAYGERPWIREERGLYMTETMRHYLRIDLWLFVLSWTWESKRKGFNPRVKTLMPNAGYCIGMDFGFPGAEASVFKNGRIGTLEDVQIYKPGEPLFNGQSKGPTEISSETLPGIIERCRMILENRRLDQIARSIWPIRRYESKRVSVIASDNRVIRTDDKVIKTDDGSRRLEVKVDAVLPYKVAIRRA